MPNRKHKPLRQIVAENLRVLRLVPSGFKISMLMMPIKKMSFYLTDRVSNYEELEPYFLLLDEIPFVVFGFDVEEYSTDAPLLPKGRDGMSPRTIRKWQTR